MSTPVTIHYQETAFTLPWDDNRQALHDRAYQVLLDGQHIDNEKRTRTFVYDLQLINSEVGLGLACARAQAFPPEVQSENKALVVRKGSEVTIKVRLSAVKRASQERSGKGTKHSFISAEDAGEWAISKLAGNGMKVESLTLESMANHKVIKSSLTFGLREALVSARVRITNTSDFIHAFLNGLGRHKGYGMGMLTVIE
jgi:hypothetical protein